MAMADQAKTGGGAALDVARFLQDLKFTPFHRRILILSCLVTFFDGLDFALISYTLPYIRDEMSLSKEMMGNVSTAAFIGQMIGSLLGSYIADVLGRRPVILVCTVLSAVLTFATGFAQTPEMLFVLRLIGGLAIGGLLAPAWSLNIEAMPAGRRATAVTIVMLGFSAGSSAAGPITNLLAPHLGWHYVFFVCGALTLALAVVLQFTLPESARWLVAKGRPKAQIVPLLTRFDPAFDHSRYDQFHLSDERKSSGTESPIAKFKELFRGWLAYITPLIWLAYFFSSFAIYLKSSFGVLFLEELGMTVVNATWIGSITGILGAITGVFLLSLTEKRGPALITLAPLIGIPFLLLIGYGITLSGPLFIPVIFIGGILVGAGHAAVISITSVYYPSAVRSTGGGWASFMAKFAAVAAPLLGSRYFLGSQDAVLRGYVVSALCLGGIIICVLILARFARRLRAEQDQEEAARIAGTAASPAE
jgi:MFS transporter, AAHS family, 4-hydroxybenzoate transporter